MTARASAVRLRTPRAEDRQRVAAIVEATGVFRPEEAAIALEVFDGAMAGPGAGYQAIGAADDDDTLLGFACFGPTPCTVGTWDLYWIAVDPEGHRRGVGRALMDAAERAIRKAGGRLVVVETSSRTDYAPTRAFYQALGYHAAARIPDFYASGDDLVVYARQLAPAPSEATDG